MTTETEKRHIKTCCNHTFKEISTINFGVQGNMQIDSCTLCEEIKETYIPFDNPSNRYTKVPKGTGSFGTDWVLNPNYFKEKYGNSST